MTPPNARIGMVYDTYFGTTVADPYRWLEDWRADEAHAWLMAQAACARAFLDGLPERTPLLRRIAALEAGGPTLSDLRVAAGRTFYLRREPGDAVARLVVRPTPLADERVLLDPTARGGAEGEVIRWYAPSPDGRYVAYLLARGGSQESTLHVLEVADGHTLDLAISRASPSVAWRADSRSFLYHRFADSGLGAPPAERFRDTRTALHRLGADPADDPTVFARGLPGVDIEELHIPLVHTIPGSAWMVGEVLQGVGRRSRPSRRTPVSLCCFGVGRDGIADARLALAAISPYTAPVSQ